MDNLFCLSILIRDTGNCGYEALALVDSSCFKMTWGDSHV